MDEEKIRKIYKILDNINVTSKNEEIVNEIKGDIFNENYIEALKN